MGRIRNILIFIIVFCCLAVGSFSQDFDPGDIPADSWADVMKNKKGTISALWYDIDPFIYRTGKGMAGVEYELMESFVAYVQHRYQVDLTLKWVDAKSFENILPYLSHTKRSGVFGWSYYSITEERKKLVKFTPPYMPDVNIIVTNMNQPLYATNEEFIKNLPGKTAYTMSTTMMEQDIFTIKNNFYSRLNINNEYDDYAVMARIAENENAFGYVPLSIYVMALKKGIKIKRQVVLPSRREGFAAVYPLSSDWDAPVNDFFGSAEFADLSTSIIKKYLGTDVTDLIFKASLPDSLRTAHSDNEMLTLEKEIVSKNLMASALSAEKDKMLLNSIIAAIVVVLIIMLILYSMYASKQKYARLLQQRNDTIMKQKEEIERANEMLEAKVMLAEMNPHLVFNSLNSLQYFISLDNKQNALSYLSGFSKLLRMIISNASSFTVTLDREIKLLKLYLEMEQIRFEKKFSYEIIVPSSGAGLLTEIPSQVIQPVTEAVLYAEVLKVNNITPFICIQFAIQENNVEICLQYTCTKNENGSANGNSLNNSIDKIMKRTALMPGFKNAIQIKQHNNEAVNSSICILIHTYKNEATD